uniref:ABC transporter G family member 23 n=1 Tax=Lygus hesperus TaxID=30085 RepID=A0A146L9A1_LYGHE
MNEVQTEYALAVRGAYKRYGKTNVILKGLNMTIPQGHIYGLLGPSGCGKTTLLNCIVGRIDLDAGEIVMKGKYRADIGYMPQDLALYSVLSIFETFLYYGRLFGMTNSQVERRTETLVKFLLLPKASTLVENLSGGQQRRVSLAVALLHDPQLLILDEPTVGLDPLLSQSIWEHLVKLASNGKKTIIITTHYIEEARQAHIIGLMRNGVLLCEDSPHQLMSHHNCDNLEQAFLQLSHKQASACREAEEDQVIENYDELTKVSPTPHLRGEVWFLWSRFMAQLIKNWYFMWRNKAMMIFLLGLPLVQCTFYNLAIGHDPEGLRVAVVNEELMRPGECSSYPPTGCNLDLPLTCRYIEKLKGRTLKILEFEDLSAGKAAVDNHAAWGLLHFSPNYSMALVERINITTDSPKEETLDAIEFSTLNVWMDMSNMYIGNMIREGLIESYAQFLEDLFQDCGWPREAANIPVKFEDPIYGSRNPSFIHAASPAVIVVFMFYLPLMFTVGVLLYEKMAGILERCMVAGVTALEVVTAHSVIQFVVLCLQGLLMMLIMYIVFDSPFVGNFFWTSNLLILQGLSGMCFGFLISVISDTMNAASFMGIGSFFPLCSMSGMLWPQEGMHNLLKSISWALPTSLPTEAMRALTARGWGIEHPAVYRGFLSSMFWIFFFCLMTRLVVKARKGLRAR